VFPVGTWLGLSYVYGVGASVALVEVDNSLALDKNHRASQNGYKVQKMEGHSAYVEDDHDSELDDDDVEMVPAGVGQVAEVAEVDVHVANIGSYMAHIARDGDVTHTYPGSQGPSWTLNFEEDTDKVRMLGM
jgi:hypothetical protein